MEVSGTIKLINETQAFGEKGFTKREIVITTWDEYPQDLLIEFIKDKCDLLDKFKVGQNVDININLRGREWINPEGQIKYFNSIQGWRIKLSETTEETPEPIGEPDDLPFD